MQHNKKQEVMQNIHTILTTIFHVNLGKPPGLLVYQKGFEARSFPGHMPFLMPNPQD